MFICLMLLFWRGRIFLLKRRVLFFRLWFLLLDFKTRLRLLSIIFSRLFWFFIFASFVFIWITIWFLNSFFTFRFLWIFIFWFVLTLNRRWFADFRLNLAFRFFRAFSIEIFIVAFALIIFLSFRIFYDKISAFLMNSLFFFLCYFSTFLSSLVKPFSGFII